MNEERRGGGGPGQRRAQARAARATEVDEFVRAVSHELRTPLRLINKLAQLLLSDPASSLSPEALGRAEMIVVATRQTGKLLDELLALSRTSQQPLSVGPVDMATLARGVVDELTSGLEERRVRAEIGELPPCEGDASLLRLVLLNLVGNALKFTRPREDAHVEVGCQKAGGQEVYFVKDNGVGFDNAYAGKLFDVFSRVHQPEDFEGSGVGLSLVKRIIERHHGRVWAEGEPGVGAAIYFTLGPPPLADGRETQ